MHSTNAAKNELTTCFKKWTACDSSFLQSLSLVIYKIWNLCKIAQVSYFKHFTQFYTFQNWNLHNI